MQLDFTAIRGNTAAALEPEIEIDNITAFAAAQRKQEQAAALTIRYKREQQELDRARAIYKDYQENIELSEATRADILKGLRKGEPAEGLLLKACKVISLMTGDRAFNTQAEKDIITIYGEGIGKEKPLEYELEQVQARLDNMQQALARDLEPGDRERIEAAVAAHITEEKRIQELLKRQ